MLGTGGGVAGALVGLAIGIALSVYVAIVDMRKRADGTRSRAQYRGSLLVVPLLFAVVGAVLVGGISRL